MTKLRIDPDATRLEKRVARILNGMVKPNYSLSEILLNLYEYGCISGMINELLSCHDSDHFYCLYRDEIEEIIINFMHDTDNLQLTDVFDSWDTHDPFCRKSVNRTLLAWFAFEQTARRLAEKNGFEF